MRNTVETTDTPGLVLMISNAGPDRVRGRVRRARDHAVGEAEVHHERAEVRDVRARCRRACASVTPLCARSRCVLVGESVDVARGSNGLESTSAPRMSMPSSIARARTSISSPRIVRSAMPRASSVAAARRMRSSSPSGSTMCLRARRGRARCRPYSNMSGVTTVGPRDAERASSSSCRVDVLLEERERGVVAGAASRRRGGRACS